MCLNFILESKGKCRVYAEGTSCLTEKSCDCHSLGINFSVGPLCFVISKVWAAVYQDVLEHYVLVSAEKLYGDADFIIQDLVPGNTPKRTNTFFNDHHIISVLDWPANSPDLSSIEWNITKRKMRLQTQPAEELIP